MVPLLIGCPPGKRLAFDVTYTIMYSRDLNKHYFDCAVSNPEMPCFLYRDCVSHPFSHVHCPPAFPSPQPITFCSNPESPLHLLPAPLWTKLISSSPLLLYNPQCFSPSS